MPSQSPTDQTQPRWPKWVSQEVSSDLVRQFADEVEVSPIIAELLLARGHTKPQEARAFLRPRLRDLTDPMQLPGTEAAVHTLVEAIDGNQSVLVFGDYDVDGITSTVLLSAILKTFGLAPRFIVPRRVEEGYGLNEAALRRALADGAPDLFVALDCGTNSAEAVEQLKQLGCKVLIIDHHQQTREALGVQLVNPHANPRATDDQRRLCTVGLVFKVVHGLVKRLRERGDAVAHEIILREYLDLVALGTVADLVPLLGENRILTHHGLLHARRSSRCGLRALFEVSGIDPAQPFFASDVAFRVGPRINAGGRLADASLPIELLLSENSDEANAIAQQLDELNQERQAVERQVTAAATEALGSGFAGPSIVVYDPSWHPGVLGIVAGKLSREFNCPALVLGGADGLAKGSGRSIPGVDLVEVLGDCEELLENWGGHPMAVGVQCDPGLLTELQSAVARAMHTRFPNALPAPRIGIDAWLKPADLSESLVAEVDVLRPFGQANREPVLGLQSIRLEQSPQSFGRGHCRFFLRCEGGEIMSCVGWRMGSHPPPAAQPIDLAIKLGWNSYQGETRPQATLLAWRPTRKA